MSKLSVVKASAVEPTDPLREDLRAAIERKARAERLLIEHAAGIERGEGLVATAQAALERANVAVTNAQLSDASHFAAHAKNATAGRAPGGATRKARAAQVEAIDDAEIAAQGLERLLQDGVDLEARLAAATTDVEVAVARIAAAMATGLCDRALRLRRDVATARAGLFALLETVRVPEYANRDANMLSIVSQCENFLMIKTHADDADQVLIEKLKAALAALSASADEEIPDPLVGK